MSYQEDSIRTEGEQKSQQKITDAEVVNSLCL
jgi:hypothetical protein